MTISAYAYRLNASTAKINDVDAIIVMADSAAHGLEAIKGHYPNVPSAAWDAIALPSAEAAAATYLGFRMTIEVTPAAAGRTAVANKKYTFRYTDTVGKTADQVATAIAAVMAASEPFANTTNAGSGVVTLSATDAVGDAAVASYVDYIGGSVPYDPVIAPNADNNNRSSHLTALAPTVQAVQSNGAARTVTVAALTNAPKIVGFFKEQKAP